MAYLSAEHRRILVIEDETTDGYTTRYIFSRPDRPMTCPECGHWLWGIDKKMATVQAFIDVTEELSGHKDRASIGCRHCEWYGTIRDDTRLVFSG